MAADPGVRAALVAQAAGRSLADRRLGRGGARHRHRRRPRRRGQGLPVRRPRGARAPPRASELGGALRRGPRASSASATSRDATANRSITEPAPDATPVDTTGLTLDEVVDQIVTLAVEAKEVGA